MLRRADRGAGGDGACRGARPRLRRAGGPAAGAHGRRDATSRPAWLATPGRPAGADRRRRRGGAGRAAGARWSARTPPRPRSGASATGWRERGAAARCSPPTRSPTAAARRPRHRGHRPAGCWPSPISQAAPQLSCSGSGPEVVRTVTWAGDPRKPAERARRPPPPAAVASPHGRRRSAAASAALERRPRSRPPRAAQRDRRHRAARGRGAGRADRRAGAEQQGAGGVLVLGLARPAGAVPPHRRLRRAAARDARPTGSRPGPALPRHHHRGGRDRRARWSTSCSTSPRWAATALRAGRVDLAALVAETLEMLDAWTRQGAGRRLADRPDCRWSVADPAMLRQVFQNLLSNAVKYTRRPPTGGDRGRLRGDGDRVRLPRPRQRRRLRHGVRATSSSASSSGCTGRRNSRAPASAWRTCGASSSGTAAGSGPRASSARARPSTSRCRATAHPRRRSRTHDGAEADPARRGQPERPGADARRAGDEPAGQPVVVARDGVEALDYLFRRGNAPGGAGRQLPRSCCSTSSCRRWTGSRCWSAIRREPRTRSIPVVMLTSSREEQDLIRSYELGVNAFVVKPVGHSEFLEAIHDLGVFWAVLNEPPPERAARMEWAMTPDAAAGPGEANRRRILHLEDSLIDAELVAAHLARSDIPHAIDLVDEPRRLRGGAGPAGLRPHPRRLRPARLQRAGGAGPRPPARAGNALHLRLRHAGRGGRGRCASSGAPPTTW